MNISKSIKHILNRASDGNKDIIVKNLFDTIKDIKDLDCTFDDFINQIFTKCINEPNFISLYVDILYDLFINIRSSYPDIATGLYRALLNKTQKTFEEDITIENRTSKINCTKFVSALISKRFINKCITNKLLISLVQTRNQYKIEIACIIINNLDDKNIVDKDVISLLKDIPDGTSQRIRFKVMDTINI
jgi:hypothetical protein